MIRSVRRFAPFALAAIVAFPLTYLPPERPREREMLAAIALTGLLVAIIGLVPWNRTPRWTRLVPSLIYLGVVALLRDAEGGTASGYGPLVLLPLFWTALYGTRAQLAVVLVGIAALFAVPVLTVGGPEYPVTEWRRIAVWMVVAPIIGFTVQGLVGQVESLARTDPLTGLPNRRAWDDVFERELARAERDDQLLAVAMLDLDHFKAYNDTHGHQAGDDLLASAAQAWREQLRAVDVLARWGGEEFVALLPGAAEEDAILVMDRLRKATPDDQTVSIGIAVRRPNESSDELLSRADTALYAAKDAGRNRAMVAPR